MRTFEVVIGDNMLDVPGRILQTPGIIYGQVGVSILDRSSIIYPIVIGYESQFSKSKIESSGFNLTGRDLRLTLRF